MTNIQSAVEAQQRAINLLSGMGGYDGTVAALIGPETLQTMLEAVPKVWTAETIKDAPEGDYRVEYTGYDGESGGWSDLIRKLPDVKTGMNNGNPDFLRAYGPFNFTPPESELA